MTELKALKGVEIKNASEGTVQAVFSTYNVKDFDGDVTLPGAFNDGDPVRISAFGHASWGPSRGGSSVPLPPVGKGVIRTTDSEAILDGRFFMNTVGGRDTFELVKEMGDLQEWSYGYDVIDSDNGDFEGSDVRFLRRLKAHEVSPVLLGAGVGTRTVGIKEAAEEAKRFGDFMVANNAPLSPTTTSTVTGVTVSQHFKNDVSFPEQVEHVLGDVNGLFSRVKGWGLDSDTKGGRQLSSANRDRITEVMSRLNELMGEMDQMLADNDPQKHLKDLEREYLRFELMRAEFAGLTANDPNPT